MIKNAKYFFQAWLLFSLVIVANCLTSVFNPPLYSWLEACLLLTCMAGGLGMGIIFSEWADYKVEQDINGPDCLDHFFDDD